MMYGERCKKISEGMADVRSACLINTPIVPQLTQKVLHFVVRCFLFLGGCFAAFLGLSFDFLRAFTFADTLPGSFAVSHEIFTI